MNTNKTMTNKTVTKTAMKKGPKKSAAMYGTVKVCANVSRLNNGMYRARKYSNGTRLSRNFEYLRDAKAWVATVA